MIQKKVCMIGAFATGKTSLVARYVKSIYSDVYHTTVGVKIDKKSVQLADQEITLILWDIYGEDDFQKLRTSYLRGSSGYLLVVDGTRRPTLDKAFTLQEIAEDAVGKVLFVLVINKLDLIDKWTIDRPTIEGLLEKGWSVVQGSAKTGLGVQEAFLTLTKKMVEG